jgi:calcineurin-like phosphoesterase family protein
MRTVLFFVRGIYRCGRRAFKRNCGRAANGVIKPSHYHPAKEPNTRQVLDSELHRARKTTADDFRMSQLVGSPIAEDAAGTTDLLVNVFDGGPRTTVEYRIGKRSPVRMGRERRPDPFVKEVFARNQATKKPWVKAEPCSHLWVARLPADLEAGTHCIRVPAFGCA